MNIEPDVKLDYSDVLLRPKRSTLRSRSEVDLVKKYTFRNSKKTYEGIPILAANMDTIGTMEMANALGEFGCGVVLHKFYDLTDLSIFFNKFENRQNHWYSMGITDADFDKFKSFYNDMESGDVKVCIDVANGYSEGFVEFIKKFRDSYGDVVLMAGNVVTADMTQELLLAGVDVVKVGIGPGSVCLSRKKAGVGVPQFSAVAECAEAAHGLDGHIVADGGITCPGDIAKAFGAGCFHPDMKVKTKSGLKLINQVKVNDEVISHTLNYNKVIRTYEYDYDGSLIEINGILSTPDHEYYVINAKDAQLVNENNLHKFAFWLSAKDITEEHMLIEC